MAYIKNPDEQENETPVLGSQSTMVDTSQPAQMFGKVSNYVKPEKQQSTQQIQNVDLSGIPKYKALDVPKYTQPANVQSNQPVNNDWFLQSVRQQTEVENKKRQDAIDHRTNNPQQYADRDAMFLQSVRDESVRLNKQRQDAIDYYNNNRAAVDANNAQFLENQRRESERLNAQAKASEDAYYDANPDKMKYKTSNDALAAKFAEMDRQAALGNKVQYDPGSFYGSLKRNIW